MKSYLDKAGLQDYTTKLHAKNLSIFATWSMVGSPLVASTAAEMTDTDKIYVYVGSETGYTSGNWYYYNGSAWASGGVYNSQGIVLDTALTSTTNPAQGKAVGDAISELSDEIDTTKSIIEQTQALTIGYGVDVCGMQMVLGKRGLDGVYEYATTNITTPGIVPVVPSTTYQISIPGNTMTGAIRYYYYTSTTESNFIRTGTVSVNTNGTATVTTDGTAYGMAFQTQQTELAGKVCRIVLDSQKTTFKTYVDSMFSAVKSAFSREFTSGKFIATDGTEGVSLSYSITDFIPVADGDTVALEGVWAGASSLAYAFYDASKAYIANSGAGNISSDTVITTIPDNAYYVRASSRISNGETPVCIVYNPKFLQASTNQNKYNIAKIADTTNLIATASSGDFTRYGTNGYINSGGVFNAHDNYVCYTMVAQTKTSVYFSPVSALTRIAIYSGDAFDSNSMVFYGNDSDNTLPLVATPLTVEEGHTIVVCVLVGNDFELHFTDYLLTSHQIKAVNKAAIRVVPITPTSFSVNVLNKTNGKYINHHFERISYTDSLSYGDSQTASVVTCDVWNADWIYDWDGNKIAQGNTNFIQSLKIDGHTGHVGPGHGCCVAVWNLFFADGKVFDPSTLTSAIECNSFRFMTKENYYLRDTANSPSSAHSYPSLDENGDPIIVSTGYIDCEWMPDNRIKMRNRLDIVYGTSFQFLQAHAGMCLGVYPYFNNVIYNSPEFVWNKFTVTDGVATVENMGGTSTVLPTGSTTSILGDQVTMFGEKFRITKRLEQVNPARYGKTNMLIATLPNTDNRTKVYLMPCVCDQSSALIATGETRESFVAGDRLDTFIYAELDVSE